MTIESPEQSLRELSEREHPNCVVCGYDNGVGLHLHFSTSPDGGVTAEFACRPELEGYQGILHGGIISSLLDGAMTNCLFSQGVVATTGELTLRFLHPVTTDQPVLLRARVTTSRVPLHVVEAELYQDDLLRAHATGKFMQRPK